MTVRQENNMKDGEKDKEKESLGSTENTLSVPQAEQEKEMRVEGRCILKYHSRLQSAACCHSCTLNISHCVGRTLKSPRVKVHLIITMTTCLESALPPCLWLPSSPQYSSLWAMTTSCLASSSSAFVDRKWVTRRHLTLRPLLSFKERWGRTP